LNFSQFAIPCLASFHIPDDFPLNGPFLPIAAFLNGGELTFSLDHRFFTWTMAVYLDISTLVPGLFDCMFDCMEHESFLGVLDWLFRAHSDILPALNLLQGSMPFSELLANPSFEKLDPDLLDLYFSGVDENANDFLLAHGGKLIRHIKLELLSRSELQALIQNPDADLNWLKGGIASLMRGRADPPGSAD
jgi:hypothetical protein